MTDSPPELRTPRLLLRPYRFDDVDAVFAYGSDEEWGRYLDVPQPYTRRSAEEDVARAILADEASPMWAIVHEGSVRGGITLIDRGAAAAELGYSLARPLWGRGLMTEAATAVVAHGFETLGLVRIYASTDVRNTASWRVMEKLGMQREALMRRHRLIRGEYVDEVFYAILREEWPVAGR